MKLNEFKTQLSKLTKIGFQLPDGKLVPSHFHVTEVGKVVKDFIDCGGTLRHEEVVNLQLWSADDYNHRLHPEKLVDIIQLSQDKLSMGDLEIEVEYQGATINKFGLEFDGKYFNLVTKQTDCLAKDNCGIPAKPKIKMSKLMEAANNPCIPGNGCC
ncbi:MAG: hypothetical protein CL868_20145 [Cytophagaceae bacterium]|nr:hypothetical protein [Cytophagaceae bacterium]|tara:strand:+ start:1625 stop:2095 length:471 start_codon:yes stop_codon:yes gene_type:complete